MVLYLGRKRYPVPIAGKILIVILALLLIDAALAYFGHGLLFRSLL